MADAVKRAIDTGFVPVVFDVNSLNEVTLEQARDAVLLRQGIEGGTKALSGETLLLGVRIANEDDEFTAVQADNNPIHLDALLEPASPLGFVALPGVKTGIEGGQTAAQRESIEMEPPLPADFDLPSIAKTGATLGSAPGDVVAGSANTPGDNTASPDGSISDQLPEVKPAAVVSLTLDPGINLIPPEANENGIRSSLLQVVLDRIAPAIGRSNPPGIIGTTISHVVKNYEKSFVAALGSQPQGQIPSELMCDAVVEQLGVQLKDEERKSALNSWQQHCKGRQNVKHFDFNSNGLVADDAAIWYIVWLHEHGHFDVSTTMQVAAGAAGNKVAVLPDAPIPPDWSKGLTIVEGRLRIEDAPLQNAPSSQTGNNPSATSQSTKKPKAQEAKSSSAVTGIKIPKAEKEVEQIARPGLIRVPDELTDRMAKDALATLQGIGLKPTSSKKLISTDRVVAVNPASGTWVKPETAIQFDVLRRVPTVVGTSAAEAKRKLQEFQLTGKSDVAFSVLTDDIVSSQEPAEGEYVQPGAAVALQFKRKVPRIEGLSYSDAEKAIADNGFKSSIPEGLVVLATDVVAKQKPPHEVNGKAVYGDPGAAVQVSRVLTIVPNLVGSDLDSAETLDGAVAALNSNRLEHQVASPSTSYTSARVLRQNPAPRSLIDRTTQQVQIELVVPLPALEPGTPISFARQQLEERDLTPQLSIENVLEEDVVTGYTSDTSIQTSRSGGFVSPGSTIALTVGRAMLNVEGQLWTDAIATLNERNLSASPLNGELPGTYVYRSTPAAGEFVDPRNAVLLHPGEKVPDVQQSVLETAVMTIQNAGLSWRIVRNGEIENAQIANRKVVQAQFPAPGS